MPQMIFDISNEVSDEENEEITQALDNLTEDDLKIVKREIYNVRTST